jgi:hypothetical protein
VRTTDFGRYSERFDHHFSKEQIDNFDWRKVDPQSVKAQHIMNQMKKSVIRNSRELPGPGQYTAYSEFGMYDRLDAPLPMEHVRMSRNSQLGNLSKTTRSGRNTGASSNVKVNKSSRVP